MRLDDLCASLPTVVEADHSVVDIVDVEHDSRRVGPGHLFACVPGQTTDGHDHAPAAIEAGAVAVLVERRLDVRVPQLVVPNVREAMGPAAAAVHGDPSSHIPVVGVTGTNGKTTTVRLIGDLLQQLGASATEIGTLTGVRTTPEAPAAVRALPGWFVHR